MMQLLRNKSLLSEKEDCFCFLFGLLPLFCPLFPALRGLADGLGDGLGYLDSSFRW